MNPNYRHTVTLYNCIKPSDREDKKERWVRTVLLGCYYKAKISVAHNGTQADVSNTYIVRIPRQDNFLPYADFIKNPDGHFTVSAGDIVVYGACLEEITGEPGQMAAQVLGRYKPGAFKVTAFSDNTAFATARHYRLGG